MKFLLDEQISGQVAERLRKQGCDAIAVVEKTALRGLTDPEVFAVAQAQSRAVVTYNRADFETIHREGAATARAHHGLVIVHPARFPNRNFAQLVRALRALALGQSRGSSFMIWLQEAQ